jgi:hypothetical protein
MGFRKFSIQRYKEAVPNRVQGKVLKSRQDDDDERNLVRDYRIKLMKGDTGDKGDKGEMGDKGLRGDPAARGEKGLFVSFFFNSILRFIINCL